LKEKRESAQFPTRKRLVSRLSRRKSKGKTAFIGGKGGKKRGIAIGKFRGKISKAKKCGPRSPKAKVLL